jgi:hypothetical protein
VSDRADHHAIVADAILDGDVVPLLGAGVNLSDRAAGDVWDLRGARMPSGGELAEWLAEEFGCEREIPPNLLRVSQAAVLQRGAGKVFKELRTVFQRDPDNLCAPTSVHRFLAELPALRASRGLPPRPQLILTTNYDDLLERAFAAAGEEYDVVYYLAQGGPPDQGRFVHVDLSGRRTVVHSPKRYVKVTPDVRTVILKIHGAVFANPKEDSWVITEDHYIDYLTHTSLSDLIPVKLLEKLMESNFLFLGYGMKDWNLRVILHRIWTERRGIDWLSWAVQLEADDLDRELWRVKGVQIHCAPLGSYVEELRSAIERTERRP